MMANGIGKDVPTSFYADGPARRAPMSGLEGRIAAALLAGDFEARFAATPELLCVRDLRGKFVRLSGAWTQVLGYPIEQLRGMSLLDLIHPADVWATHDVMQAANRDEPVERFVNRYRHRDGQYRQLEWTARRVGDRVFGVARDVTSAQAPSPC
jgi:PAS domain S-box-containing protein